jgi:hypothetical protein
MSITLYVILWAALALVVVGMAIYRNILGIHEPALHVARASGTVQEAKEFSREENIERWGQRLTVIVIVYGLVLASAYLFIVSERGLRILR